MRAMTNLKDAKIGILGTGDVGRALGKGFTGHGHKTMLAGREANNEKAAAWAKEVGANGSTGTFADAAKFGDVLVLATSWSGTENVIKLAGADHFKDKIVIDATNPLAMGPAGPSLALAGNDSGGEQVQRWLPGAHVVKAFNTIGNGVMVNPKFEAGKPDMFIAGNDAEAKKAVTTVLEVFGWETIDLGGIESARLLEPLAMIWVKYGFANNSWGHAFKLLRK